MCHPETITDLAPSLAAGDIPRYFTGNGLTKVISHIISEAGGEPELGAGRGKVGTGDQEEAQGDQDHDVTERRDWSPSPSDDLFIISTCHVHSSASSLNPFPDALSGSGSCQCPVSNQRGISGD